MLYSLSLIVILTSVLTGPSPVDAAWGTNRTYGGLRKLFQSIKCASGSNENELKKFHYCYNKTREASDSKFCEPRALDTPDECLKTLDKNKIGDAKGIMAFCKANGDWDDKDPRMKELIRCVLDTRVRLCPKLDQEKEYRKWLAHAISVRNCVKEH